MTKYDSCVHSEKRISLRDIDKARTDCENFKQCLHSFGIRNIYDLYSTDPTVLKWNQTKKEIFEKLKAGNKAEPQVNYLIICMFAGHGILRDGSQYLVFNQFDKQSKFYKMMNVEIFLRNCSDSYSNSYMIGIFACCREIYKPKVHTGYEEAKKDRIEKLDVDIDIDEIEEISP